MVRVLGIHHLALVTGSIDATIRFWRDLVGLELRCRVGGPGYRQYFFAAGGQTLLAFFTWPGAEPVPLKDHGVPQRGPITFDHVALELGGMDDLVLLRDRLAAAGFWVSEPMDQGFVRSIYTFDPNGVPVEFAVPVDAHDPRRVTWFADRDPGAVAREGSGPQPGVWPAAATPRPGEAPTVYPGLERAFFAPAKK